MSTSDPSTMDSPVDAAAKHDSLSPTERTQRRDSLEKHLQQRPDAKDLKDRHILLDSNAAPSLQAAQYELEKQRVTDSLKKGLETRPEREDLENRNILPQGSATTAPSLHASQRDLQKHMRKDSLEKALQNRPKPEDLVKDGILEKDETPSAVE